MSNSNASNFMELGNALKIVHELADQNKLEYEDADNDDELLLQVEEHQLALDTVEDFIVNHFGED